jgi:hypothetical protein
MASRAEWAERVEQWRRSGQTSEAFCAGKDFTPGGLRKAASLMERAGGAPNRTTTVRVAKVTRVRRRQSTAVAPTAQPGATGGDAEVTVELGGACVAVRRGCDSSTLRTVLEALMQVGGGR